MPAPRAILAAAVEGAQVDFDTASLIETRYATSLVSGQIAKNLMQSNFFDQRRIRAGEYRPAGVEKRLTRKVGVVGAGMMGARIAYVVAKAGVEVVVKDVSIELAKRAKQQAERLEALARAAGETTETESFAVLDRIQVTGEAADLADVDFVVEAVFEDQALKEQILHEIEQVVPAGTTVGSNTSTLPITGLAEAVRNPADFVGVHFFSPVDRMPLLEIVRGRCTSDVTLARAYDFALQIGKTPIVVNDSRGFFTSRIFLRFLEEASAAVGEGVEPASVEQAGLQAGFPAAPLQLLDDLTLTLPRTIQRSNRSAATAAGGEISEHGSEAVLDKMIGTFGRTGRAAGGGFYDYDHDGRRTRLWPGLRRAFGSGTASIPLVDLQERMLFTQALEAVRCLDEGVLTSVVDGNVGSLLGIGYPSWTGGVFQYINQYDGGVAGFVVRAQALAGRYGDRFVVPPSLAERAERDSPFQ